MISGVKLVKKGKHLNILVLTRVIPVNLWNSSFGRFFPFDTVSCGRFLGKCKFFLCKNSINSCFSQKNTGILTKNFPRTLHFYVGHTKFLIDFLGVPPFVGGLTGMQECYMVVHCLSTHILPGYTITI